MKLDMEIKPKDIKLLKILGCFLIGVIAFRFFLLPGIDKYSDLKEEKVQVSEQKEIMENSIKNLTITKAKVEKLTKQLNKEISKYNPVLENRLLDELVTGIVLKHHLFPSSLSIGSPTQNGPQPYMSAVSNEGTKTETEDMESTDENRTSDLNEIDIQFVNTTLVSLSMTGSEANIHDFIDDIAKNYKGIQIRSIQMGSETGIGDNYQVKTTNSCQCTLAVYTCGEINAKGDN